MCVTIDTPMAKFSILRLMAKLTAAQAKTLLLRNRIQSPDPRMREYRATAED
jgi:hypothetical protein